MNTEQGDAARYVRGIDGTAGDAQDIPHQYAAVGFGDYPRACVVCALGERARVHREYEGVGA